jgi:transposase
MDGDLFEGWLEQALIPALGKPSNAVLVMDNASWHRKAAIYEMADEHGFKAVFLPPYSPNLNPIEKFWANAKRRMRLNMHRFNSFSKGTTISSLKKLAFSLSYNPLKSLISLHPIFLSKHIRMWKGFCPSPNSSGLICGM